MRKKSRKIRLGNKVREWMDIPMEAFGSSVRLTMSSNTSVLVENHRGIMECAQESVRFRTEEGILRVEGTELILLELNLERALVKGGICGIQFEK